MGEQRWREGEGERRGEGREGGMREGRQGAMKAILKHAQGMFCSYTASYTHRHNDTPNSIPVQPLSVTTSPHNSHNSQWQMCRQSTFLNIVSVFRGNISS